MAIRTSIILCLLALAACGGGEPASPTASNVDESSGGEQPAQGESAAAPATGGQADGNVFNVKETDASSRPDKAKLKPTHKLAAIRFIVVDKDKGPIRGIVVSLTAPNGETFYTEETDKEGFAEVLVPVGQKYDLVYLSLGRKDVAAQVPVSDAPGQNIKLTLRYKRFNQKTPPPQKGEAPAKEAPPAERFVLTGVQFDTGKATLRPESFPRLDEVVEYMTHKKSARIEISGHTDNVGNPASNKTLSQKRAESCRDYLVSKGIEASRIDAVGHGDEMPVASNDTEEGRQKNRRIEATEL